jgi:hypothetical protein
MGEYWVEVTNEFGCARRDTMMLTINDVPAQPLITTGPESVDNFLGQPSSYACEEVMNAISYTWTLSPENAGTISGSGANGEVIWATGFTGTAQVSVTAANDCGNGMASEAFVTSVFSSQGLNEMESQNLVKVYPNPGDGRFSLKLPASASFRGDLIVTDGTGSVVYSAAEVSIEEHETFTLNLSALPAGYYGLKLQSGSLTYYSRLIIQRK